MMESIKHMYVLCMVQMDSAEKTTSLKLKIFHQMS